MLSGCSTIALPVHAFPVSSAPVMADPVRFADPLAEPSWDDDVLALPGASFFHGSAWARVLHQTYGHRPAYVCPRRPGQLASLLPLMEVSSPFTGKRGVSLPFTDFCPALAGTGASSRDLLDAALAQGRRQGWKYLELRGAHPDLTGVTPSVTFHGHYLKLTPGADALVAGFDPSVRRGLRKAATAGVQVEITTSLAAVRTYYRLHCQTRQRHGLPPQPFRFFQNLHDCALARGAGFVALATYLGQPAAGAVFLHLGRQLIYKFGASDFAFQSARPNHVLFAHVIRHSAAQGFQQLHFGRTSLANEGLRRFKLSFGASEETIPCYRYSFRREGFVPTPDRAQGSLNSLFRLLPVPVLRNLGEWLYPHLS
jgi:CelD/BcsL family acetyltransferase involved in cellulose biosynthesis